MPSSTPQSFADASKEEQIALLEGLGRAALKQFGVSPISLTPLVHAENTTFRVQTVDGDFCLRISRPGYQSTSNIRSEIEFLAALSEEGFRVPRPWQRRLVAAQGPGVPEARDCVLFHWIEGEIHREGLTCLQWREVGQLMARLHQFVETWSKPTGFDRQKVHTWLLDVGETMAFGAPSSMVEEQDRLLLVDVAEESRQMAAGLPRDKEWIQLIHSDLHAGNLVFKDGLLHAIDFDDTGYGFLIYDFAAGLAMVAGHDDYSRYEASLLDGYSSVRSLPPRTEELLPQFLKLRLASIANWSVSRIDNPEFREFSPRFCGRLCERIRSLSN